MKKNCTVCKLNKSTKEFCFDKRMKLKLSSKCKACNYLKLKEWRAKNRLKVNESNKAYKKRHPEQTRQHRLKHSKIYYKKTGWKKRILKRYGISYTTFESMKLEQKNKCAICDKEEVELHIDHCHKTGKIRGLLCQKCNTGIGLLGDDLLILNKAVKYLNEKK